MAILSTALGVALPEPNDHVVKRDCTGDFTLGETWPSGSFWGYLSPEGGCAWYYCNGDQTELWIDCGEQGCEEFNGDVPGCF